MVESLLPLQALFHCEDHLVCCNYYVFKDVLFFEHLFWCYFYKPVSSQLPECLFTAACS